MARRPTIPFSYWPGGIPTYIQFDDVPTPHEKVNHLIIAWRYFTKVNWISRPAGEKDQFYEVNQQRDLASKWAQAPQSLRNEYHNLAILEPTEWEPRSLKQYAPNKELNSAAWYTCAWYTCIAPLDTPQNRTLWTKLRILSYDLGYGDNLQGITTAGTLSASPHSMSTILEPIDFMKSCIVEVADFFTMAMTTEWVLADQQALETARLLWARLENNGSVSLKLRITTLELETISNQYFGCGREIEIMRHSYGYDGVREDIEEGVVGESIDVIQPILGILGDLATRPEFGMVFEDGEKHLREIIEIIAPGYLELEDAGNGDLYDHSKFKII